MKGGCYHIRLKRGIQCVLFACILALFFCPYCHLIIIDGNGKEVISQISGVSFIKAIKPLTPLKEMTSGMLAILVLSSAVGGLLIYLFQRTTEKGYGFLFALAGIISLVFLQINIQNQYTLTTANGTANIFFACAYWLSAGLFAIAACVSFLYQDHSQIISKSEQPSLHINIITQTNAADNK